ncbi:MAG: PAS domain S-box protein [Salinivirgaceae bacterium]|nr:PAS domain S-box protein [Salinivirgaceae bacterium]
MHTQKNKLSHNLEWNIINLLLNIGNSYKLEENRETICSFILNLSFIDKCWIYISRNNDARDDQKYHILINNINDKLNPEIWESNPEIINWKRSKNNQITEQSLLLSYFKVSYSDYSQYFLFPLGNYGILLLEGKGSPELPIIFNNKDLLAKIGNTLYNCLQQESKTTNISDYIDVDKQSRLRYHTITDSVNEGVLFLNEDLEIIYFNPVFAALVGWEKEIPQTKTLTEFMDQQYYEKFIRNINKTTEKPFEIKVKSKNGTHWVLVNTAHVDQDVCNRKLIVCTFLDIHDKKTATTLLFEKEQLMSQLIASINDFFWIYDVQKGVLVYTGPNYHKIFGSQAPNPEKSPFQFLRIVHPEDISKLTKTIRQSVQHKEIKIEFRIKTASNGIKQIRIKGSQIIEENGKRIRYAGIASDITQQKETEKKLFETSLQLINTVTAMKDYLFLVDSNQKIISQIPSFQPNNYQNKNLQEVRIPKEVSRLILHAFQVLKYSTQPISYDVKIKTETANLWFNLIITRRSSAETEFDGIAIHVREITQRNNAQEELKISSNIDEIIANTSTRFINIPSKKVDSEIELVLEQIGLYFSADYGFTYLFDSNTNTYIKNHKWKKKSYIITSELPDQIDKNDISHIIKTLSQGNEYKTENKINQNRSNCALSQKLFVNSINIAPIITENKLIGFTGFAMHTSTFKWDKHHTRLIKMLSEIFANALNRKATSEKLNATSSKIKTIIQNLNSGVLLENKNHDIEQTNQKYLDLFNITSPQTTLLDQEFLTKTKATLFANSNKYIRRREELKQLAKPYINEELTLVNGKIYERDYTPILFNNETEGHFWQYRDITEKKQAEWITKQNEQRLNYALDAAKEALWEWTIPNNELYLSPRWTEITGTNANSIKSINDFLSQITQEYKSVTEETLNNLTTQKCSRIEIEIQIKNENIWILLKGKITEYKENNPYRVVGTISNITQQKALQQELLNQKAQAEEATEIKSRFIANISHEIRTPMYGVVGLTELLSNTTLSQDQQKFVNTIKASSNNMLTILNDLLDVSKLTSGKFAIKNTGFELTNIVSTLYYTLQGQTTKQNNTLSWELDEKIATISIGDPVRINQILLNLLNNALKFTNNGTVQCKITCKQESETSQKIRFSVIDNGIGIKQNDVTHIFERYNKASQQSSVKYGGTGLGLAISRQLVDLMGSTLYVKSRENEGTIFWFSLELKKGTNNDLPKNRIKLTDNNINKFAKIVVADDNPTNILILKTALRNHGNEPIICTNGAEVLEILKKQKVDLIILDIQMPILDGYETTKKIRKDLKLSTPIIGLSAETEEQKIKTYINAGMNSFFPKPFDLDLLITSINELLSINNQTHRTRATFSLDKIRYLTNNNKSQINQLIETFLETTTSSIEILNESYKTKNWEMLYKTAHRIKPTIDTFDIIPLNTIIRKLESHAQKQNDSDETQQYVADTTRLLSEVCIDLKKIKQQHGSKSAN